MVEISLLLCVSGGSVDVTVISSSSQQLLSSSSPFVFVIGPRESKYTFLQESDDQIQASSAKEFNNIVRIKLRPMKLLSGALVGLCCLSLMPSCLIIFWLAGGAETLLTPHIKDYSSLVFSQLQELSSVGLFDIIAMSGSFLNTESNGTVSRTCILLVLMVVLWALLLEC
ncbi:uncharacterized protein LOC130511977 isoform X1 [Raphanus sativus]|uniref:Uncharacterized protein LOC130511977 isoform X1 n=1 Tax=Raphanus sativus TaxID=3726 RepID=A0A9W3DPW1_RAPSA|nr:uncharacterized protein LOC130511977 isoform X1 [Raphanus sativus]